MNETSQAKEASESLKTIRVLYVEDTENDQIIMKRFFEKNVKFNYELVIAKNGAEGLKNVEEGIFDLIFLDYNLPDMTGLDLLNEIEKRNVVTPVIFVTGQGSEKVAVEAMKHGARDYIVKADIGSDSLIELVKNILLGSALPKDVDPEAALNIAELFSKSSTIEVESFSTLKLKPESDFPLEKLVLSLEILSKNNVVESVPLYSTLACPSCGSLNPTLYLQCQECKSLRLTKGDALEHFTCGCIDFRFKFDKEGKDLICPKCGKQLKQIGVDYRRIESWYECSNGHFFGVPNFVFKCQRCNKEFKVDEAAVGTLHQYRLTERGRQQLRLGLHEAYDQKNAEDHVH
jgi:DNA-binding response OmpR family regulator/predicted RNA-binding Zn-ribbon protein involved in translation (DUF1610 family)